MSWNVAKMRDAAEASAAVAGETRSGKGQRKHDLQLDAKIYRGTITDASQYSDGEALVNHTLTRQWGAKKEFMIRVSSVTVYREVFVIRYGRLLSVQQPPDEPDPIKKVLEERTEYIKRAQKVIDRRFPPPQPKTPA